jgi:hypothetical protein
MCSMTKLEALPVKLANQVSSSLNRMLLGQEARRSSQERGNASDEAYWYAYQLQAEKELQEMGLHLYAPLE